MLFHFSPLPISPHPKAAINKFAKKIQKPKRMLGRIHASFSNIIFLASHTPTQSDQTGVTTKARNTRTESIFMAVAATIKIAGAMTRNRVEIICLAVGESLQFGGLERMSSPQCGHFSSGISVLCGIVPSHLAQTIVMLFVSTYEKSIFIRRCKPDSQETVSQEREWASESSVRLRKPARSSPIQHRTTLYF